MAVRNRVLSPFPLIISLAGTSTGLSPFCSAILQALQWSQHLCASLQEVQMQRRPCRRRLHFSLCTGYLFLLGSYWPDIVPHYRSQKSKNKTNHATGRPGYLHTDGLLRLAKVSLLVPLEWREAPLQLPDTYCNRTPETPISKMTARRQSMASGIEDNLHSFSFRHAPHPSLLPAARIPWTLLWVLLSSNPQFLAKSNI